MSLSGVGSLFRSSGFQDELIRATVLIAAMLPGPERFWLLRQVKVGVDAVQEARGLCLERCRQSLKTGMGISRLRF